VIAALPEDDQLNMEPEQSFDYFRDAALANNPEIAASMKKVQLAKNEVLRAEAGHAPRVDLVAFTSRSQNDSTNTVNLRTDSNTVAIQVQVPLFSGFGVEGQRMKSIELAQKARNDHEAIIQKILFDLRKNYTAVSVSKKKVKAFQKAVDSSFEAAKAAEIGLKAGVNIEQDALVARQQLTKARLEASKVKYDSILSGLMLRAGIGTIDSITISSLGEIFKLEKFTLPMHRTFEEAGDESGN
jgi:protease secretion system outer membrane protein